MMQLGIHGWTQTQHEIGEGFGPRSKATSLLAEPLRDWDACPVGIQRGGYERGVLISQLYCLAQKRARGEAPGQLCRRKRMAPPISS